MSLTGGTTKTVLELDLVSYSDIALVLEENLDVHAVKVFQDQIQSFVDEGLRSLGLHRNDVVFGTAGDNALLFFDDAATAHRFAAAVQMASADHNRRKSVESAKRWFRIGAATGVVLVLVAERRIVGTTVARAVRLEAAARRGELVVDAQTFDALPDNLKAYYSPEEVVRGKRDEEYSARRCTFIEGVDEPDILPGGHCPQPPIPAGRSRASRDADGDNLLHRLWDDLEPELQDAFSLAYNQARREKKDRISTRTFFAALARLEPGKLSELFDLLPKGSLPEPISANVPTQHQVLEAAPKLSSCVENALLHLDGVKTSGHKLGTEDVFVDIAKFGTGPSVVKLRTHGVTPEVVDNLVSQLGWSVLRRSDN